MHTQIDPAYGVIMFSNIIGQENAIDIMRQEMSVTPPALANSMIFYGEKYSGKLTTALELTRVLNCKKEKKLHCDCENCNKIRELNFDALVLLSRRSYFFETKELIKHYRKEKSVLLRDKIYQNMKLTFAPLQDFLLEKTPITEADKKQLHFFSSKFSDFLDKEEYNSTELEELEKGALFFSTFYKNENIPVSMIRNMLNWSYVTHREAKKVVIIDNVDQLETSSENILLKRLEEPSENLYFILLATQKNKIIQTIRSRCRSYFFHPLTIESKNYLLKNRYLLPAEEAETYSSLQEYFHQSDPLLPNNLQQKRTKLLNLVFLKTHTFSELYLFIENEKNKEILLALIKELHKTIVQELLNREYQKGEATETEFACLLPIDTEILKQLETELRKRYERTRIYNLTPKTQLEGVLYPLKEMILHELLHKI